MPGREAALDNAIQRWMADFLGRRKGSALRGESAGEPTEAETRILESILARYGGRAGADKGATAGAIEQYIDYRARAKSIAGHTYSKFKNDIKDAIAEKGSPGKFAQAVRESLAVSPERAAVIARTELGAAENTGIYIGLKAAGHTHLEWLSYKDGRSGDRHHERMDGKVVKIGEPFRLPSGARLRYPCDPAGPVGETINCVLPDQRIGLCEDINYATRRAYSGECVRIEFAGQSLTCTPNHPVLTARGWVAACCVSKGDHTLRAGFGDFYSASGVHAYDDKKPPTAAQIFDLAVGVRSRRSPGADLNFHSEPVYGEVDIIAIESELMSHTQAPVLQHLLQTRFKSALSALAFLKRDCALGHFAIRRRPSRAGNVRSLHLSPASVLAHLSPLKELGLGPTSNHSSALDQSSSDYVSAYAGPDRDGVFAFPGDVCFDDFDRDIYSSQIVTSVAHSWHDGPVYNFSTKKGWYTCNGTVVHNCRCTVRSVRAPGGA